LTDVPIEINKLVNLEVLGLGNNELTKINDLSSLVKLSLLNARRNELTAIPNINKLVNLEWLDLEHNELTSIQWELCEMRNLRYVDLSSNYICDDDSVKIFDSLKLQNKLMNDQKQLIILPIILPMVII